MSSELEKRYIKKPKEILVLDCIFLEKERERLHLELRKEKEYSSDLSHKLSSALGKMRCLANVNGKLTDAVTSLRDGILI